MTFLKWMLSDVWQILCLFLSIPASSITLLPIPSLLSPLPQSWFTLRMHLVLLQAPVLTRSTHHCCQILSSAIHVASFDLPYIFFWAQIVLLGYGSTQTWKPMWLAEDAEWRILKEQKAEVLLLCFRTIPDIWHDSGRSRNTLVGRNCVNVLFLWMHLCTQCITI